MILIAMSRTLLSICELLEDIKERSIVIVFVFRATLNRDTFICTI